MALPPGAIGSAVREEKLAWPASGVKSAFPICSSVIWYPQVCAVCFLAPLVYSKGIMV
jgi:hypothetical protein